MNSTHCIFYMHIDRERRDPNETSGRCLDQHDANMDCYPCLEVIRMGHCCKKLKTPVL